MSLQSIIVGALPEYELAKLVAKPEPVEVKQHRNARPGPRKVWTTKAMAKRLGVSESTLCRWLQESEELRELLRWHEVHRRRDHLTADDIEAARVWMRQRPFWRWSRHSDVCVVCERDDHPHRGKGVCRLCASNARKGHRRKPHPDAWDQKRGLDACRVCHSSERPHESSGCCSPCWQWVYRIKLDTMTKTAAAKLCATRRAYLRRRERAAA